MTNKDLTYIAVLIDSSGSMSMIKSDMEGAINSYLTEQAAEPGECRVTVAHFDSAQMFEDWYVEDYLDRPIADVKSITINPRGGTALHDAIGRMITDLGERLAKLPEDERPGSVILPIVTDGLENSSVKYGADEIKSLVKHQSEQYHWLFVYLGANQDAIMVGEGLGIPAGQALTYQASATGVQDMSASMSRSSGSYRSAVASGVPMAAAASAAAFTDEDREAQEDAE